jgi:hypothetical protein
LNRTPPWASISKVPTFADTAGAWAALCEGNPTGTRLAPKDGAAMMKITNSTSITSTMGVTLMSLKGLA